MFRGGVGIYFVVLSEYLFRGCVGILYFCVIGIFRRVWMLCGVWECTVVVVKCFITVSGYIVVSEGIILGIGIYCSVRIYCGFEKHIICVGLLLGGLNIGVILEFGVVFWFGLASC